MVKNLVSLIPFIHRPLEKRPKHCSTCDRLATFEAHFDGGGVIITEKYCDGCSKKIARRG